MTKRIIVNTVGLWLTGLVVVAGDPMQSWGQTTLWNTYQAVAIHLLQTGRPAEAEPYLDAALREAEQSDPQNPQIAATLNALGMVYATTGRLEEAQSTLQRSLDIRVKAYGPEHPEVAVSLESLALLHSQKGAFKEATMFGNRALQLKQAALGPTHPEVGMSLITLANIHMAQGNYQEAETHFRQGLSTFEQTLGPSHPVLAEALNNLAVLYSLEGDNLRAEPLFIRALALAQHTLGPQHPRVASILTNYAQFLKESQRDSEAFVLERAAEDIAARQNSHPPAPAQTTDPPTDPSRASNMNLQAGHPTWDGNVMIR